VLLQLGFQQRPVEMPAAFNLVLDECFHRVAARDVGRDAELKVHAGVEAVFGERLLCVERDTHVAVTEQVRRELAAGFFAGHQDFGLALFLDQADETLRHGVLGAKDALYLLGLHAQVDGVGGRRDRVALEALGLAILFFDELFHVTSLQHHGALKTGLHMGLFGFAGAGSHNRLTRRTRRRKERQLRAG
jgi:hypothetical protein